MKKALIPFCGLLWFATIGSISPASAQTLSHSESIAHKDSATYKTVYKPHYWYVGAEVFSPFIFDDLYSWTRENKIHIGKGLQLKIGYQFSSIFGIEATLGWGQNYVYPNTYQHHFWLGSRDAYTYYPYTLIDGTTYYYPFEGNDGILIGEQGNNPSHVKVEGVPFSQIRSRVRFWQSSINATINLTRLFYTRSYTEKPVELWLRPGIYLSKFDSKVENTTTGERAAIKVNRPITWGVGTDLALRFNISKRFAIDLTNRIVWNRDREMDGVMSAKRAYDGFVWEPALGLVYKFRGKEPIYDPTEEIVPSSPETLLNMPFWYPAEVNTAKPKTRSHTAAIYLTYPLNKTYIQRDLHNNQTELARIDREIRTITDNPDYTVRHILVEGFASPEGPYDNNMRLGEGRARSIIDYIVGQSKTLHRGLFTVGRMTENWSGLRDTLTANPSLPGAKEVLELMDREKDTEIVKQKIKNITGYDYLLENVYPRLRLSSYTVEYEVKDYRMEEAQEILKSNPSLLSAEEIYSVAYKYGLLTEKGQEALAVLNRLYPDADITLTYAGIRLLEEGNYEEAVQTLRKVTSPTAEAQNALGVAYTYTGRVEDAQKCFQSAATNSSDARQNLNTLLRKLRK